MFLLYPPAVPGGLPLTPIPTTQTTPNALPIPTTPVTPAVPGNPLDIIHGQFQALPQQNAVKDAQLADMAKKLKLYEDGYLKSLEERQKADQAVGLLKQQAQEISARMEALTKEASAKDAAARTELTKLRNESKMVSDMMASKEKQFAESGKAVESLQKERDLLRGDVVRLQDELAKAKRDNVKPDEMAKLLADNSRLKQELEVTRQQVETLKVESAKKDADLAMKEGEIVVLKTQLGDIQAEIAKLRQENTGYQTQVADLTMKLKEMTQGLDGQPTGIKSDSTLAHENQTLRAIIMRNLRQQERLRQSKELVINEMRKMENVSRLLMENLEDMTAGKVRITVDEEALFSEPELREILAVNGVSATLEATTTRPKTINKGQVSPPVATGASSGLTVEEKLLVQAENALQSQDYKAAEQNLKDALRANPKNATALLSLAGIKINQRKQDEAEVLLQKALVYQPNNAAAHYRLGVCYFQQNKLVDASNSFEKAARNERSNARAHHYLGIIASKMSNRARAEAEFKSALAVDPGYGDAHFNLAVLYATGNPPNLDRAREHYRLAIKKGVAPDASLERLINSNAGPAPRIVDKTAAR